MPGFDGRGPNGQGPRTGRGLGRCGGADRADYGRDEAYGGFGRGFGGGRRLRRRVGRGYGGGGGRGFGGGRGAGWWTANEVFDDEPPLVPQNEVATLQRDRAYFEQALKEIHDRLDSIEGKKD